MSVIDIKTKIENMLNAMYPFYDLFEFYRGSIPGPIWKLSDDTESIERRKEINNILGDDDFKLLKKFFGMVHKYHNLRNLIAMADDSDGSDPKLDKFFNIRRPIREKFPCEKNKLKLYDLCKTDGMPEHYEYDYRYVQTLVQFFPEKKNDIFDFTCNVVLSKNLCSDNNWAFTLRGIYDSIEYYNHEFSNKEKELEDVVNQNLAEFVLDGQEIGEDMVETLVKYKVFQSINGPANISAYSSMCY
jgi:hypothetical protein